MLHALLLVAALLDDRWPHFSPGGREIAFTSTRNGPMQAFVMNSDGRSQHVVSAAGPGVSAMSSAWFPNGDLLYVNQLKASTSAQLYATTFVRSASDGASARIIFQGMNTERPTVSPSGETIALESSRGPFSASTPIDILKFQLRTLTATSLTKGDGTYVEAAWSPDGSRIAFACGGVGARELQICVMNADGTHRRVLTNGNGSHEWPAWSPDSGHLAYFVYTGSTPNINADVWTMAADGAGGRNLTAHQGTVANETPSWSPDGKTIAFQTNRNGAGFRIAVMDADGRHQRVIT